MNNYITHTFLILFFFWGGANALHAQKIFNAETKPVGIKAAHSNLPVSSDITESREFFYNPLLRTETVNIGDQINIDGVNGQNFTTKVVAIEEYITGIRGITSKIDGYDFGYAFFAASATGVVISIHISETDKMYTVAQSGLKHYLFEEFRDENANNQAVREAAEAALLNLPQNDITESIEAQLKSKASIQTESFSEIEYDPDEEVVIKIMFAYSKNAKSHMGGEEKDQGKVGIVEINKGITIAMLQSQLALDISDTGIKLELVGVEEDIDEWYPFAGYTLNQLIADGSGESGYSPQLGELRGKRDEIDADILVYVFKCTEAGGDFTAGLSYSMSTAMGDRWKNGVVVVTSHYLHRDYVVVHEMGHLFGGQHHLKQPSNPGNTNRFYEYGTAWRGEINGSYYISLMGYSHQEWDDDNSVYKTYKRIPYFSSPTTILNGKTIGDPVLEDNRRVMRESKHIVRTYGKGIRLSARSVQKDYGAPLSTNFVIRKESNLFDLRNGDKIVYMKEDGNTVGTYKILIRIEDSVGNDVKNDSYYKGNTYIVPGEYTIAPRLLMDDRVVAIDKVYDGTTKAVFDFSYYYNANKDDSFLSGDDVAIDDSNYAFFSSPDVGTNKTITVSGENALTGSKAFCYDWYDLEVSYKASITKAPLEIKAKSFEIEAGTNPASIDLSNAYTITGLVNNEPESVLSGSMTITIDPNVVTSSSPPGTYPNAVKIQGGYTSNNYEITHAFGNIVIKAAEVPVGLVTIGSTEAPVTGALLQLKNIANISDGGANATKGLLLPRVPLTNPNKLYPMLASGYDDSLDALHVGLVVFNTNEDAANNLEKGIYVWDGTKWNKVSVF